MQVKNFEDLEIWKDARALTRGIYQLTGDSKFSKDFGLRDQIRRAAVSIMSNIAEGFERGGNQEFIQFLYVAKASCGEVRSQLYVALDQSYMAPKDCDAASKSFRRLSIMISNLIEYLKNSGIKDQNIQRQIVPKIRSLRLLPKRFELLERLERLEPRKLRRFPMIHPGRILLEEYLAPRCVSVWHLARDIGVPVRRIYEIVEDQRPITADIAHRLAHYFGMSERYWLDLQARFDRKREDKLLKAFPNKQSLRFVG